MKNIRHILIDDGAIAVEILIIFSSVHNEIHGLLPVVTLKLVLVLYQLAGGQGHEHCSFSPNMFSFPRKVVAEMTLSISVHAFAACWGFQGCQRV